ncbi:TetR/AcrR family transcriptional regulator [Streptosporangium sp. NPDC051023]|uniref:TetR/AcrR family transcriptional regulator n=1 Tax=Streptosporangium sp. NPDC051023 TaxID=3155410 RepID=UPI00344F10F1
MARPPSALRDHILRSALRLFADSGYKGTSLHDIAQVTGCSKAALLYHFAGKEAILTELLTPAGEELAALDTQLTGLDGEPAAWTAVTGYVDLAMRFRLELKILFQDLPAMTSHPALGAIPSAVGRLLTALAGGSAAPADTVAAYMVLGAVCITVTGDLDLPDEVLRAEMIHSALRTLGREPARP